MKKNTILFVTAYMVLILIGCAPELELNPNNSVTEEIAVDSEEAIQSLLVGAYDRMADTDVYGGWIQMNSDLLGTNFDINWGGTFTAPDDMWQKVMSVNNGQAELTWYETYEVINITNIILANLDIVSDPDEAARIEGEAKFIRGAMYFELVRLYARDWADGDPSVNLGVPLKVDPTDLDYVPNASFIGRSTVEEVYTQILDDLTDSEQLLGDLYDEGYLETNGFYATTFTAKAMLARVHMQQRNYEDARVKANEVIESGEFQLADRVDRAFNQANNSSEDVFAIQVTAQDGVNDLHTFYASRDLNGRRDIRIRSEYRALFEPTDDRIVRLIYEDGTSGRFLSGKYKDQFANISIIRLAEMYLIRAEGNLIEGDQVGPNTPGQDLQVLRDRAKAPAAPVTPTIDDIMLERKLELGFEGHFLHDIRRREATIGQLGPIEWNDPALVMPIPQREMDANPALQGQQNEGYGS